MSAVPIRTLDRIEWIERQAISSIRPIDSPHTPVCELLLTDGTTFRVAGFAGEIEAVIALRERSMTDLIKTLGKYPGGPRIPADEAVLTGVGVALNKLGKGDELLGREIMYAAVETAQSKDGYDRSWIDKFWSGIGLYSA
jgi:hypothetical protein